MKPRDIALKELKSSGYTFKRSGGNHDIFYNAEYNSTIPLKRHDFNENDLRYIRREIKQNQNK
ncbi:MAG: type II toxin-antitoxin system HicA family toxin [Lachnospiraceae bacterium]|nr:type II toxin-antitoxin system HicA family toxin [Lachnospiraceae bacterium]